MYCLCVAVELHKKVAAFFLPTAVIFHYVFNLRDLSNVFGGLMLSKPDLYKTPQDMIKLFYHEAARVYSGMAAGLLVCLSAGWADDCMNDLSCHAIAIVVVVQIAW